jgi:CubicO group peptidase (beta-lactamase class C family)
MRRVFPEKKWIKKSASDLGFSKEKLCAVSQWVVKNAGRTKYRVLVVRNGYIVAEWSKGISADKRLGMASAAKSLYSSMLGIVIEEGNIPSADTKVFDYYPEMMDIKNGEGPKQGRFSKPEDRDITFRQLISNMSGYMKPGETPGSTFHYQTFGMNILAHAIAKLYGYYDSTRPKKLPGFGKLVEEKIRDPIGGRWSYKYFNFSHPRRAKKGIFGYYTTIEASAHDMARMGYLWLNGGNWGGNQIVPEKWLREATRTAPNIKANCSEERWRYGYAFWTNDYGRLWPDLPLDSYAASGAQAKHIWVCPSLDVVVVQSPGIWSSQTDRYNSTMLRMIVDALDVPARELYTGMSP